MKGLLICTLFLSTLLSSCNKAEFSINDCVAFRAGLQWTDKEVVSAQVQGLLAKYTRGNVDRFAEAMEDECGIIVQSVCFDCIKTNPAQSSIQVEFMSPGGMVTREIDLGKNSDNKMILINVH
jgi:hypothetical protein